MLVHLFKGDQNWSTQSREKGCVKNLMNCESPCSSEVTKMALLHRFLRLSDAPSSGETGVFTFIVTRAVVRADEDSNVTTKDFT